MQEHQPDHQPPPDTAERSGHADVEQVLRSLDTLDDLPVSDHVEVFDRAHEGLRTALDDAARDRASSEG